MAKKGAKSKRLIDTSAILARGEMALGLNQCPEALAHARSILRKDRAHVGALELLAKGLWQSGQFRELLIAIRRLIQVNPYEPGYFALQGAACQALGRYAEAAQAYGRSLDAEPGEANSLVRRSLLELQRWQSELIGDLLRQDARFRAQYSRDPMKACRDRGFNFVPEPDAWLIEKREETALFPRPS